LAAVLILASVAWVSFHFSADPPPTGVWCN